MYLHVLDVFREEVTTAVSLIDDEALGLTFDTLSFEVLLLGTETDMVVICEVDGTGFDVVIDVGARGFTIERTHAYM